MDFLIETHKEVNEFDKDCKQKETKKKNDADDDDDSHFEGKKER